MSARNIVSICIGLEVRGCTNFMCIQLHIPYILCPFVRTYVRVSPALLTVVDFLTVVDIRKVRRRKKYIWVHFCILFSYSVGVTSGIVSEPRLVDILLLFIIAY